MNLQEKAQKHSTLAKLYDSLATMQSLGWDDSYPLVRELKQAIKQMEEAKFDFMFGDKKL